ncbi:MAG: hypothetical protein PHN80_14310 [Hespellia sp.]|nr:hypothetical protein [Hespellia sp.]
MQAWEEKVYERLEGREEGLLEGRIELIRKKVQKDMDVATIADLMEEPAEFVQKIYDFIKANPFADTDKILAQFHPITENSN